MGSIRPLALLAPFLVLSAGCSELSTPTAVNAPPAFITNGTPTGDDFGAVGALLFDFDDDGIDGYDFGCSGSLIAPTAKGIQPLQLPPAGYLDGLARKNGLRSQLFLNVGYGYSASARGQPDFDFDGQRNVSQSPFMSLTSAYLGLRMNSNATGEGGDCYGDSGSPKFLEGNPTLIVAVTSTGDFPCRATTWSYRRMLHRRGHS